MTTAAPSIAIPTGAVIIVLNTPIPAAPSPIDETTRVVLTPTIILTAR